MLDKINKWYLCYPGSDTIIDVADTRHIARLVAKRHGADRHPVPVRNPAYDAAYARQYWELVGGGMLGSEARLAISAA